MKEIVRLLAVGMALAASATLSADPLYIAHRGFPMQAIENTIKSYMLAIELGQPWALETDVRACKGGGSEDRLVLFHDERTDLLTNSETLLEDLTLEEVQALKLQYKQENLYYNGVTKDLVGSVPSLREFLGAVANKLGEKRLAIVLDIKALGIAQELMTILQEFCRQHEWSEADFWCIGPNYDELAKIKVCMPGINVMPLLSNPGELEEAMLCQKLDHFQSIGARGVLLVERTAGAIEMVLLRGMEVWMGFVDERPAVVQAHNLPGVSAMILNTPDHLPNGSAMVEGVSGSL